MKKFLLMALALTGFLFITTACSEDDHSSDLPVYDADDFGNRISEPEWAKAVTWYDNTTLVNAYDALKTEDLTLKNTGYYEYKLGMNYSTGQEQDYWYKYTKSGSSIYVSEGKFYTTSFNAKLADLSWSEEIMGLYNTVWNIYTTRTKLSYVFLVAEEGSFGDRGAISLSGTDHQVVDLSVNDENKASSILMTDGENMWSEYSVLGAFNGISESTIKVYVTDVRQTVLDNLDLIQAWNAVTDKMATGPQYVYNSATKEEINLDDIRAALK